MSLSNKIIADAQPGDRIWDDTVRGLCLRVSGQGRKAFYLNYRTRTGQQRGPKLADIELMTLTQARETAKEWLAKVTLGGDPMADWKMERLAPTMADLGARWLNDHGAMTKPRTLKMYTEIVNKYVNPKLGKRKAATIQHEDVDLLHKTMKNSPYMANRVLAAMSCMFNYAEKNRMRPAGTNPCRHVKRFKEEKRNRYMTKLEAPKVAAALASYEETNPQAVAFIYLLMLSGARPIEITKARREWVERVGSGGVLRLPDSKTGAKPVFLPPQVMQIIDRLPKCRDGRLFNIKSPKYLWDRLRVEVGAPDFRLYDLRHTFASAALEAGYSLAQIGELLGHASAQTTKRYAHLVDEKAHEAAANTAGLLERMMNPTAEAAG